MTPEERKLHNLNLARKESQKFKIPLEKVAPKLVPQKTQKARDRIKIKSKKQALRAKEIRILANNTALNMKSNEVDMQAIEERIKAEMAQNKINKLVDAEVCKMPIAPTIEELFSIQCKAKSQILGIPLSDLDPSVKPKAKPKKKRKFWVDVEGIGIVYVEKRGKWKSSITHEGKTIFLGYFEEKYDAQVAYDEKAIALKGPDAKTNKSIGKLKRRRNKKYTPPIKKSRFIGVSWHNNKKLWRSAITFRGKIYVQGYFEREDHAAMAYDKKAREFRGWNARTNETKEKY